MSGPFSPGAAPSLKPTKAPHKKGFWTFNKKGEPATPSTMPKAPPAAPPPKT